MTGASIGIALHDESFTAGIRQLAQISHNAAPLMRAIGVAWWKPRTAGSKPRPTRLDR